MFYAPLSLSLYIVSCHVLGAKAVVVTEACILLCPAFCLVSAGSMLPCVLQQKNIMAERNVLLKSLKHPFLVGLHYSFQTPEKLYFVLDYVNGGEVAS